MVFRGGRGKTNILTSNEAIFGSGHGGSGHGESGGECELHG